MVSKITELALAVIETEAAAVAALADRIDAKFVQACEYLLACTGRIIVTGMGKSGHIGRKIAATLASTGSPAFYVHPGEASHGDMGMITANDVLLAISYSGFTQEIVTLLPLLKRLNVPLITLSADPNSPLAMAADININIKVSKEACPLGLAPTASTTATLVMGDALAISLLDARGFSADDFAWSHPGGSLGKRLLLKVGDLMHSGSDIPKVSQDTLLVDALLEITQKKLGMTTVLDAESNLIGIFTDGDLRRSLENNIDIRTATMATLMTTNSKTTSADALAVEALNILENFKITTLVVLDQQQKVVGVVHMHDIIKAGV